MPFAFKNSFAIEKPSSELVIVAVPAAIIAVEVLSSGFINLTRNQVMQSSLIETGVPRLDDMIGGGVTKGNNTLIIAEPGIDSSVFLSQIAYRSLQKGMACLYYVEDRYPKTVAAKAGEMKMWDAKKFEFIQFIDGFTSRTGIKSGEKYAISDPTNVKEVTLTIDKAVREHRDTAVLFFDQFDRTVLELGAEKALELLDSVIASAIEMHTTCFFTMVNWDFSESFIEEIRKRFEYVVAIKAVEEKSLTRNYFYVEKAPIKFSKMVVPFRIGLDGLGVYVPKILITGPFHAGKSSFIQKVSTRAVSIDRIGTTVALDHGYIDYGGVAVDLFGTPGQERFEFMLDILKKDTFGVVLLVDSTDPQSFSRALEMLHHVRKEAIPYVIAANKQDVGGALSIGEIRKLMKLPEDVPIIPTSAVIGTGCLDAVKSMIDIIVRKRIVVAQK